MTEQTILRVATLAGAAFVIAVGTTVTTLCVIASNWFGACLITGITLLTLLGIFLLWADKRRNKP